MAKEYVPIYLDFGETTQDLTDAEVGRLIRAIVAYARGDEYSLQGSELIAFRFMKGFVDRNDALSRVRSEAGQKGGQQTAANRSKSQQTAAEVGKKTNNKDSVSSTDENTDDFIETVASDDAAKNDQFHLIKAAENAGFRISDFVRNELLILLEEHGLQKMLDGIRSCSEHDAPNLAYLRAVLRGEPKKQKGRTLPAQDFPQRDYSGVDAELMQDLAAQVAAFKAAEAAAG